MTKATLELAREYLLQQARPLERARFRFLFDHGPAEGVLAELGRFQNPDGGFGHGLEPDTHTPASSAVATTLAFAVFRQLKAPAETPAVRRAIGYLVDTFDPVREVWEIVPPAVEDAPHAPWWTYAEIDETFHGSRLNPTCAAVGALYDYSSLVPAELLATVTTAVLARLAERSQPIAVDEFRCLISLAATPSLPDRVRAEVRQHARRAAAAAIETNPARWSEYRLQPLDVIQRPDSFLAAEIDPAVIQTNLDYWIDLQLADGSWPLTWSWAEVDEVAWRRAEVGGKSQMAVERLETLRAFGRLAS